MCELLFDRLLEETTTTGAPASAPRTVLHALLGELAADAQPTARYARAWFLARLSGSCLWLRLHGSRGCWCVV